MATSVTINMNLSLYPFTFSGNIGTTFSARFTSNNPTTNTNINFTILTAKTATVTFPSNITAGEHTFVLGNINNNVFNPSASNKDQVASVNITFDTTQMTPSSNEVLEAVNNNRSSLTFTTSLNCIHGSSLIEMKIGRKRIDEIKVGDEVLSNGRYAKVLRVEHCWLTFEGIDHDALIFEENSLGKNQPFKRLIIDPGHPICTQEEYEEKGLEALKPAGEYRENINVKKWTDIFVQSEPSRRYDLVLEKPYNTYTANGIVVQSKGYKDHRYGNFR